MLNFGSIEILVVDGVYRLRISGLPGLDDRLDELEAEGETLSEALINLHGVVEAIEA